MKNIHDTLTSNNKTKVDSLKLSLMPSAGRDGMVFLGVLSDSAIFPKI